MAGAARKPTDPMDIMRQRSERMRASQASNERQPIATLALARVAPEEVMPIYDATGFETETRRRVNVFLQWRESGATDDQKRDAKSLSAHGVALMSLYAKAHGVAGGKDVEITEPVDEDATLNQDQIMIKRALARGRANDEMAAIMVQVGFVSASILTALCHDWFFGDGKPTIRANGRREAPWRAVVRKACKAHGRTLSTPNEENMAVWECLKNLQHARW